jgi:flagellum-specific peptidoglycan hydrolase FlgJ
MLKKVPTVKTFVSTKDFIHALISTWIELFQETPKKESVGVILSQWSVETGQGKYCWNYNIGNVKAKDIPGTTVEYVALNGVWEITKAGKKIILPPTDPGAWFLAFPSLHEGMKHHLKFLKNKRYKIAWSAVELGDVKEFARLLKVQKYYTAPESDYARIMSFYFNKYMSSNEYEECVADNKSCIVKSVTVETTPLEKEDVKQVSNTSENIWTNIINIFHKVISK